LNCYPNNVENMRAHSISFCDLFYNIISISDYVVSNGRVIGEQLVEKGLGGCGHGLRYYPSLVGLRNATVMPVNDKYTHKQPTSY
jgi:hypothetical protein